LSIKNVYKNQSLYEEAIAMPKSVAEGAELLDRL
jgi:hypothetical protein